MVAKQRNGAVEVLRCALMFFVVVWHATSHGIWANDINSGNLVYCLLMWHVPAFVAISGWFGIHFGWWKFFKLYGVIVFIH